MSDEVWNNATTLAICEFICREDDDCDPHLLTRAIKDKFLMPHEYITVSGIGHCEVCGSDDINDGKHRRNDSKCIACRHANSVGDDEEPNEMPDEFHTCIPPATRSRKEPR